MHRRALRHRYGHGNAGKSKGRVGYGFTVIIPYIPHGEAGRTVWHPTDPNFAPLSRGFFKTTKAANAWAKEHLGPGAKYTVRRLGRY